MFNLTGSRNKIQAIFFIIAYGLYRLPVKAQTYQQAQNSVYQYAVKVGSKQAYLWVPPKCKQVKGIIISFANLLERNWLEDPIIRKTAEKNNLAIVLLELDPNYITPDLKPDGRKAFLKMLNDLADESGYPEVANAPFIPIDHSVHGVFTWTLPAWLPERTIAAIPVKTFALPPKVEFSGIPMCYIIGETDEWPTIKDDKPWSRDFIWPVIRHAAVKLRSANENTLINVVTDAGGGHLDWSDKLSTFMALFIDKACQYRLPASTPKNQITKLKSIIPHHGWLTDTSGLARDLRQPAPYLKYQGNPKTAYWFFDKETALAAASFNGDRRLRKKQMLTFTQNGWQATITKQGFIALQYIPEQDGISFRLKGDFLPTIPPGLIGAGQQIGHADGTIKFRVITGPAVQVSPGEFKVVFNRSSPGGDIWIQEEHPGNQIYAHAVQPAQIKLQAKLTEGKPQTINFPQIANQRTSVKQIKLLATTDTGFPVNYYVVSGPAIIKNDMLLFTEIPVKSRYPVKVTVTAYQWGQIIEPLYQSATPITQTFYLTK
jgi:hypothetical protein